MSVAVPHLDMTLCFCAQASAQKLILTIAQDATYVTEKYSDGPRCIARISLQGAEIRLRWIPSRLVDKASKRIILDPIH